MKTNHISRLAARLLAAFALAMPLGAVAGPASGLDPELHLPAAVEAVAPAHAESPGANFQAFALRTKEPSRINVYASHTSGNTIRILIRNQRGHVIFREEHRGNSGYQRTYNLSLLEIGEYSLEIIPVADPEGRSYMRTFRVEPRPSREVVFEPAPKAGPLTMQ